MSKNSSNIFFFTIYFLYLPCTGFTQEFLSLTRNSGFGPLQGTNGVALADYDRDGDIDVYFVVKESNILNSPITWNRLLSNRGDGTFLDVTAKAGLAGQDRNENKNPSGMGNKMGAAWGDYDNDGWPDLYLTHFGPNQLFHNNGDGTFTDVTEQAGVATSQNQMSSSALWFDYDNDGDLDLYVSVQAEFFTQPENKKNKMYENLGDGTFADVSEASGLDDNGKTWTTVAFDANNDGLLDLYLANDFGRNKFYVNNGNKKFTEKTADYGLEDRYHGMGLAITDCDGNGFFDLYLTNIAEASYAPEINPLFMNTGQNFFINSSVDAGISLPGWGWGTEFFDLENDGDDDLFVATGNFEANYENVLYRNISEQGGFEFENVTHTAGIADLEPARGVAIFDFDNDGVQDILVSNYGTHPELYKNTWGQGNWLKINLEGTTSNRNAFGAVVEVFANDRTYKKYHHGAQFLAQNIIPLHFGLNTAQSVDKIKVYWPGGHTDEIESIATNQSVKIVEGEGLTTGVLQPGTKNQKTLPNEIELTGNYPNPFNGSTRIEFRLAAEGKVRLNIVNAQGKLVKSHSQFFDAGENTISWDATDNNSNPVSSGIYFYILTAGQTDHTKPGKLIYIK